MVSQVEPMDIDAFTEICGHFTSDTNVNNGYGCTHPEQEEWEYVKKDSGEDADDEKVKLALIRKQYGSYQAALEADKKKELRPWLNANTQNDELLANVNVCRMGKCFAHSCPLAYNMEEEDWRERGEDPDSYSDDWVIPRI